MAKSFTRQAIGNMILYSCFKKPVLIFTAKLIILKPTLILKLKGHDMACFVNALNWILITIIDYCVLTVVKASSGLTIDSNMKFIQLTKIYFNVHEQWRRLCSCSRCVKVQTLEFIVSRK